MTLQRLSTAGIIFTVIVAFAFGIGLTAFIMHSEVDPWKEALRKAGYDSNMIAQLLDLPNGPTLETDSLGFQQATGALLYREVDENGKPLIAVYYIANKVILNNLPQPTTAEDSAKTADSVLKGDPTK